MTESAINIFLWVKLEWTQETTPIGYYSRTSKLQGHLKDASLFPSNFSKSISCLKCPTKKMKPLDLLKKIRLKHHFFKHVVFIYLLYNHKAYQKHIVSQILT